MSNEVDIKENDILRYDHSVFSLLLVDRSKPARRGKSCHIIWATDNCSSLGKCKLPLFVSFPKNLSQDKILYIQSLIKLMPEDTLFGSEEIQIDQNFGAFNLLDHGVKVGDKITYTPANIELTVLSEDQVEYNGEKYSIADFTAKFMPENSISKSGVCKGPKYFSYKGVSLYKLKESFLGGSKKK